MSNIKLFIIIFITSSNYILSQDMENKLANEKSLYLKQHATNPVNWFPWNDEALSLAKNSDKLLLISVGYSSCHWCHVMEEESFTDDDVAQVMNLNFINIKIDREERPDLDEIYMKALVLMTGSGGWPMNIIALPDGTPIWGGTYVPKTQWIQVLNQVSAATIPLLLFDFESKFKKGDNIIFASFGAGFTWGAMYLKWAYNQ